MCTQCNKRTVTFTHSIPGASVLRAQLLRLLSVQCRHQEGLCGCPIRERGCQVKLHSTASLLIHEDSKQTNSAFCAFKYVYSNGTSPPSFFCTYRFFRRHSFKGNGIEVTTVNNAPASAAAAASVVAPPPPAISAPSAVDVVAEEPEDV